MLPDGLCESLCLARYVRKLLIFCNPLGFVKWAPLLHYSTFDANKKLEWRKNVLQTLAHEQQQSVRLLLRKLLVADGRHLRRTGVTYYIRLVLRRGCSGRWHDEGQKDIEIDC
mmetsp:Transcript_7239/g.9445  ORF Transcript_7239/g.9445 Transcript_7239/m.9445 type:complete len:113 (-) Transcript_7239:40-378(-)